MSNLPGRLGTLTARDIMTRSVITLTDSDSVEAAVRELRSQSITGAPVVDDNGIFVGILSLSDLVCRRNPESSDDPPPAASLTDKADAATWELFDSSNPLAE